jgi:hypothetical protein
MNDKGNCSTWRKPALVPLLHHRSHITWAGIERGHGTARPSAVVREHCSTNLFKWIKWIFYFLLTSTFVSHKPEGRRDSQCSHCICFRLCNTFSSSMTLGLTKSLAEINTIFLWRKVVRLRTLPSFPHRLVGNCESLDDWKPYRPLLSVSGTALLLSLLLWALRHFNIFRLYLLYLDAYQSKLKELIWMNVLGVKLRN